jgi:hypothetical protein
MKNETRNEMSGPFLFDHMALKGNSGAVRGPERDEQLPWQKCDTCGQKDWHPLLARYGLGVPESLDRDLFRKHHVLSIEEFDSVLQHIPVDEHLRRTLLPGTRIGSPSFKLLTAPYDFVSEDSMFVSERTLDVVRARGVRVDGTPVNVFSRGKGSVPNYYHIVPNVASIMDPEWLKLELVQCWRCENWWPKPGLRSPKLVLNDKARVLRSQWPERVGVVYAKDIRSVYYSAEFVQACQDAKLTGMGFQQVSWA